MLSIERKKGEITFKYISLNAESFVGELEEREGVSFIIRHIRKSLDCILKPDKLFLNTIYSSNVEQARFSVRVSRELSGEFIVAIRILERDKEELDTICTAFVKEEDYNTVIDELTKVGLCSLNQEIEENYKRYLQEAGWREVGGDTFIKLSLNSHTVIRRLDRGLWEDVTRGVRKYSSLRHLLDIIEKR